MKSVTFSNRAEFRSKASLVSRLACLLLFFGALHPAGAQMLVNGVDAPQPTAAPAVESPAENGAAAKRYLLGHQYLRNGMKAQGMAELKLALLQNDFILADHVALDLAALAMEEKDYQGALDYLEKARKELEAGPLKYEANRLRLMAACADVTEPVCGKTLAAIPKKSLPGSFHPARRMMEAERAEKTGKPLEAFGIYHEVAFQHPASPQAAAAMERREGLRQALGAKSPESYPAPSYKDRLGRALRLMDANQFAGAAAELEALIAESQTPERDAMLRRMLGSALYKARAREKAREVLAAFVLDYPDHDERQMAEYLIAMIDWNNDLDAQSRARLESLADNGTPGIKGLANYTLGRMAETGKRYKDAAGYFAAAARHGVPHRLKSDLWWRMGWVAMKQENFPEAAELFRKGGGMIHRRHDDGRFIYWRAKALEAGGEQEKAAQAHAELGARFPYSFYGLADKVAGLTADPVPNSVTNPAGGSVAEADPPEELSPAGSRSLARARLLIRAERLGRAEMELDEILVEAKKSAPNLAWLGAMYVQAGAAHRALRLFGAVLGEDETPDGFEDAVWRLAYPVNHWDNVSSEAVKANMDPLLPLAVIRQESSFNGKIVSKANAIGLMQLVPNTGEKMYNHLRLAERTGAPFSTEMLFKPQVNITLGVAHLSELLTRYDGSLTMALAAYNAGSPAVDQWRKRLGQIPEEEFIEMIPFTETRDYVKKVLRNLALYRSIYSKVEVSGRSPMGKQAM